MKKNKGFTLAEVLVTLGIIGVVAALTTPALIQNVGDAKIEFSFVKFKNNNRKNSRRNKVCVSVSFVSPDFSY